MARQHALARIERVRTVLCRVAAACALGAAGLVWMPALAQGIAESVAPTGALANALARQRDAQNVLVLSS